MAKKIKKQDIAKLLDKWSGDSAVLVPSRVDGIVRLAGWDGKDTGFLEWYRNTVTPPKAVFLPAWEKMFSFRKDKNSFQLEPAKDGQKQVLFGIRPCDARALSLIDLTFKDGYADPYYTAKKQNTTLVGLGCSAPPYDTCFCTSLGLKPAESTDVDLMLTDIGGEFLVEEITEAGKALLAEGNGIAGAKPEDEAKARQVNETAAGKISKKSDTKNISQRLLAAFNNHKYWEEVAAKCLGCGICTFHCPTCYCFDINDEMQKKQGSRLRSWDSCAFCVYTKMPMENPREHKWQRVRQKVCHKYEFYPMNFDVIACTGCGRCIRQCPVNWDITQTLASLPASA